MPGTLLVLGGSGFVGPAVVLEGLARGFEVSTFHRETTGWTHRDVRAIQGDRLTPESLEPLRAQDWDLVVDTWSLAPRAVRDSARALRDRADRYVYISSESVYRPPPPRGVDESAPTVDADPDAEDGSYPEVKAGGELAVSQTFGDRCLLARAGLILGPYEDVGRLTWWLSRMARGGEIVSPGPADQPIQYVDARDLAGFVIDAAGAGHSGPFNVVCRRGHATMGSLLEACRAVAGAEDAALRWMTPEAIAAAGIEPWTELPIWLPPDHEMAAMHDADVRRALAAGLTCRPVEDTVADTWTWLSARGSAPPLRPGSMPTGLAPDREREVLRAWAEPDPRRAAIGHGGRDPISLTEMRIAIAGAHGQIGLRLVRLLAARGDEVVGLIRNPGHAPEVTAAGGEPVVCDLEHAETAEVAAGLGAVDVAVFAAGAGPGSGAERKLTMDRDGAIKLLRATDATAARYLMVSSVGAESPPAGDSVFEVYLRAKAEADAAVTSSDRGWVIVRPGPLTDDPGTGHVRIGTEPFRGAVPRDDVAGVLAALIADAAVDRTILYLGGGDAAIADALAALRD